MPGRCSGRADRDAAVMAFHPAAMQGADGMVIVALVDHALHIDLTQGWCMARIEMPASASAMAVSASTPGTRMSLPMQK